jgi:hypothetical protein
MSLLDHTRTAPRGKTLLCCLLGFSCAVALVLALAGAPSRAAAATPVAPVFNPASLSGPLGAGANEFKLTTPAPITYGLFGSAVAISGDTALVTCHNQTVDGTDYVGAVYVYVRNGSTWTKQAELDEPTGASGDYFGTSVAISGNTAVVGTPGRSVNGKAGAGAVYVFTRTGTAWGTPTELTATDAAASDQFGWSVAFSGGTVVAGAYDKMVGGSQEGAAYVFTGSGSTWSQQQKLTPTDPLSTSAFGVSVAVSGDTALIGSMDSQVPVSGEPTQDGGAFIFTRSGTTWSQQAELIENAADYNGPDRFGWTVALDSGTAVVGARDKMVSGSDAGAAYVFTGSGANWSQQARLLGPYAAVGNDFGNAVAVSGNEALVGCSHLAAPDESSNGDGAAFLFTRSGSTWSQPLAIRASDYAGNDAFGCAVGVSGTLAVIGADTKTVSGLSDAGAAYAEQFPGTPTVSLKASAHKVKTGKKLTLSGVVKNYDSSAKSVVIERKIKTKLVRLKSVAYTKSGAFKWVWKAGKAGKWVFLAVYKLNGTACTSKTITVVVHR